MELRWTQEVAADLERIADYLVAHTPERAARPRACAVRGAEHPADFPSFGRPGKKEDTRELMLSPLPYIVIYYHDVAHPTASASYDSTPIAIPRARRKRQRLGPNGSIESDPAVLIRPRGVRHRAGSLPIESHRHSRVNIGCMLPTRGVRSCGACRGDAPERRYPSGSRVRHSGQGDAVSTTVREHRGLGAAFVVKRGRLLTRPG